jgi:hypothetical protein
MKVLCPFKTLETPNPVTQCHITRAGHSVISHVLNRALWEPQILHSFIPSARAECDDSLPGSLFHSSLLYTLSTNQSSNLPHFILPSISWSTSQPYFQIHTYVFGGILLSSILCTCPNQHNLFNLTVSVTVVFFNQCINSFTG